MNSSNPWHAPQNELQKRCLSSSQDEAQALVQQAIDQLTAEADQKEQALPPQAASTGEAEGHGASNGIHDAFEESQGLEGEEGGNASSQGEIRHLRTVGVFPVC